MRLKNPANKHQHTTDTHGWLAGHLKERNYGADWGDFASFVTHMRAKAARMGVDLLVVDTGVRISLNLFCSYL
jgi:2',3'-cyclic-nucleotide 2'-phosphodiesterase (5'-nucleotidase family)